MNVNKIDFYNLCLEEGHPFYQEIFPLDRDLFNHWVIRNLQKIARIESFTDVTPSKKIIEGLSKLGYEHVHYQCHYSAKAASILNWIFRSIVRHDSAAMYATHSAGNVASVPLERLPLIPLQSTPL